MSLAQPAAICSTSDVTDRCAEPPGLAGEQAGRTLNESPAAPAADAQRVPAARCGPVPLVGLHGVTALCAGDEVIAFVGMLRFGMLGDAQRMADAGAQWPCIRSIVAEGVHFLRVELAGSPHAFLLATNAYALIVERDSAGIVREDEP